MTIQTPAYCETRQSRFFPSTIPVKHHQLRHLLSSPEAERVYFVNGHDVFCVDTAQGTKTVVAQLPFEPKCIATGSGWFCAGGCMNGGFASFRLENSSVDGNHNATTNTTRYPPHVRVEKLGKEIINSISIHTLNSGEVVALLTNNDSSVKMYSLSRGVETKIEDFPFPMNHASISPDGRVMMIVGDQEFAYFYECLDDAASSSTRKPGQGDAAAAAASATTYRETQWEMLRAIQLHKPPRERVSGYFTTAWSPSGRLCACASEHGYIVVFDVDFVLSGVSAGRSIVAVIPSSEPCTIGGAVRCLQFHPWDLLLWTEHSGRFVVADLRDGLDSRQVIDLDPQGESVTRISLRDVLRNVQNVHQTNTDSVADRLSANASRPDSSTTNINNNNSSDNGNTNDRLEALMSLRQSLTGQQQQLEGLRLRIERNNDELELQLASNEERMLLRSLNGLREDRRRLENIIQQGAAWRFGDHANANSGAAAATVIAAGGNTRVPSAVINGGEVGILAQLNHDETMTVRGIIVRQDQQQQQQQQHLRQQYQWRQQQQQPQQSNTNTNANTNVIATVNADANTSSTTSPSSTSSSTEAWRTIESAMRPNPVPAPIMTTRQRRERMRETLRESSQLPAAAAATPTMTTTVPGTARPPLEVQIMRQMGIGIGGASVVGVGWRPGSGPLERVDSSAAGRGTTGVVVGESGRVVYVGITEGFFEFRMNFEQRKTWSAYEPR